MPFTDIAGQDPIKHRLYTLVKNDRLGHAHIFIGQEVLPIMISFAQLINCENPNHGDSCGTCNSCKKSWKHIHPDIGFTFPVFGKTICGDYLVSWREKLQTGGYMSYNDWLLTISGDFNKQGNIPVGEMREIIRRLSFTKVEGRKKIQLIWGGEYIGKEGNAILKLLEEPPDDTILIIGCEDGEKLLSTILSRTQIHKIPPLPEEVIANELIKRKGLSKEMAVQTASISDGSWTHAMRMCDYNESDYLLQVKNFLNLSLSKSSKRKLISIIDEIALLGRENIKLFLHYFLVILQKSIKQKLNIYQKTELLMEETELVVKISARLTEKKAEELIACINKSIYDIERNGNLKLILFNVSLAVKFNI